MKTSALLNMVTVALLALPFGAQAESRKVRIQDLTAVSESGLTADQVREELMTAAGATFPDSVNGSNYPSVYTSGNNPNMVTQGNSPNVMTNGNYPSRYTTGRAFEGAASDEIPMPNLNL